MREEAITGTYRVSPEVEFPSPNCIITKNSQVEQLVAVKRESTANPTVQHKELAGLTIILHTKQPTFIGVSCSQFTPLHLDFSTAVYCTSRRFNRLGHINFWTTNQMSTPKTLTSETEVPHTHTHTQLLCNQGCTKRHYHHQLPGSNPVRQLWAVHTHRSNALRGFSLPTNTSLFVVYPDSQNGQSKPDTASAKFHLHDHNRLHNCASTTMSITKEDMTLWASLPQT